MRFTFKAYSERRKSSQDIPTSESPNPSQKRREQIRRAQKSHRERKEAYVKSLENEVVELRTSEAKASAQTKAMHADISTLQKLLIDHGNQSRSDDQSLEKQRSAPVRNIGDEHGALHSFNYSHPSSHFDTLDISESTASAGAPSCLGELEITTTGLDFVLTLEGPCLGHSDSRQEDQDPPNGHSFTLNASLLHQHPAGPGRRLDPGTTWQVPNFGIERLLELSNSIPLDGEVTPVQAWNHIRRHPQYQGLEVTRLQTLEENLSKHVKCYGFGGVVDQGVFENAVFDAVIVGRVF